MGRVNGEAKGQSNDRPFPQHEAFNMVVGTRGNAQRLLHWFDNFGPQIEQALAHAGDTHTPDDLFELLLAQRVILMCDADAFIIAEVVTFPRAKHLHLWLAGSVPGRGEALRELSHRMGALAKDMHCTRLTMSGREGWLRALEHEGWSPYHQTLAKGVQ